MRTCNRMQSFIRHQRCGDLMAAGRYGDAPRRVQIKFESLLLFGLIWFSRSGSLRSISHAIRRPPHTSRAPGRGVARAALTPSPPDLDNSPASSACVVPLLASNGWVGVSTPSSSTVRVPYKGDIISRIGCFQWVIWPRSTGFGVLCRNDVRSFRR